MSAYLTGVALVCTPVALVMAWLWLDEWLAGREDARRRAAQDREVDAERSGWFDRWYVRAHVTDLIAPPPCMAVHDHGDRCRDRDPWPLTSDIGFAFTFTRASADRAGERLIRREKRERARHAARQTVEVP